MFLTEKKENYHKPHFLLDKLILLYIFGLMLYNYYSFATSLEGI